MLILGSHLLHHWQELLFDLLVIRLERLLGKLRRVLLVSLLLLHDFSQLRLHGLHLVSLGRGLGPF